MGRRGRKRARAAQSVVDPPDRRKSLPADQQMARVNLSSEEWRAFRSTAVLKQRSVAEYLGHLVRKELRRVERADVASKPLPVDVEENPAFENPFLVTGARDTRDGR